MSTIWHKIRAYATGIVTLIACPCHLPITLLIWLTAGTAFSAWLSHNTFLIGVISTVVFFGGATLAFKWFSQPYCPPASASSNRGLTHTQTKTRTATEGTVEASIK